MRALVTTFVLLVVAGSVATAYLAVPPEDMSGEPHVNVKVEMPAEKLAGVKEEGEEGVVGGKVQGSFTMELPQPPAQAQAPKSEPVLPSAVTAIPEVGGAAATGSGVAPGLIDGGITVTIAPD